MYLDHTMTAKIAAVLERIDASAMLLDCQGNVLVPEGDERHFTLPQAMLKDPQTPLVYGGVTLIGSEATSPLVLCLHGDSKDIQTLARVTMDYIKLMMQTNTSKPTREMCIRQILRGEVSATEIEVLAKEYDIPLEKNRCVLYFYFSQLRADEAGELLRDILENSADIITEINKNSIAVLKTLDEEDLDFDQLEEFADAMENTFLSEYGNSVYIGISNAKSSLYQAAEAFEEARDALNIGHAYYPNQQVFLYRSLLLERFLNGVSSETANSFYSVLFNRKTSRLFNEEMLQTIQTFFDNSLNLSETARKLYIHRNTLVYRLEKVQKATGLDLRVFDDAVTFKLVMLLGKNMVINARQM